MVAVPVSAILTSSVFINVSTTVALSVAVDAALAEIPAGQKVEALAALVLLVGAIQVFAGLFRLGFLIRFVSNAVMIGFLNGVAVLIILGQLSDLTGYQSAFSNRVVQRLDLLLRIGEVNVQVTLIGSATLAAIVLLVSPLRRFAFNVAGTATPSGHTRHTRIPPAGAGSHLAASPWPALRSAPVSLRAGQSGRTLTHGLASRLGADQ